MRAVLLTILLTLWVAAGCGEDAPTKPERARTAPELAVCPVEGTRFAPAHGVEVKVGDRTALVCSPGCAFRLEIDPTILDDEGR